MAIKAEKVRAIADLLDTPEKWVQAEFDNAWLTGGEPDAFCIDGAIIHVIDGGLEEGEYEEFFANIIMEMHPGFWTERWPLLDEADMSGMDADDKITNFNDCHGRTWDEINRVMEKAIVKAEEMEGLE